MAVRKITVADYVKAALKQLRRLWVRMGHLGPDSNNLN